MLADAADEASPANGSRGGEGAEPPADASAARNAFLARRALRRQLVAFSARLQPEQLLLAPDGHSVGFGLKVHPKGGGGGGGSCGSSGHSGKGGGGGGSSGGGSGSSGGVQFVPALHVSAVGLLCSRQLRVTFDGAELPPRMLPRGAASELPRGHVARGGGEGAPVGGAAFLRPWRLRWQTALVWAVNSALLLTVIWWLLFVLRSRELVRPGTLHAGALEDAEWRAELRASFAMQLFYSFVVIDGVKIGCLTLTSGPALEGLLPSKATWPLAHAIVRKPLRRMHKILDVLI